MEIKTKYNIGDKVFFIQENAVHQGFIKEIAVYVSNDGYSDIQREYYLKSFNEAYRVIKKVGSKKDKESMNKIKDKIREKGIDV